MNIGWSEALILLLMGAALFFMVVGAVSLALRWFRARGG
ncbi:MAG: hypothetical protein KatS3mg014_0946 [Actinomycetota bacterium]|nr:MAG: hypothetical protein KatS3mg014_0946 [Actinomycetota bacterium]